MVVVARFARGEDIQIAGRTTGASRINTNDSITPGHPYLRIDRFPCQEASRRAGKHVGVLFDQPFPHQLVMLLVLHTLAVRTRCHDYRNWILRFWSVDIR